MIIKLNEYNEKGRQMRDVYGDTIFKKKGGDGAAKPYTTQNFPMRLSKDIKPESEYGKKYIVLDENPVKKSGRTYYQISAVTDTGGGESGNYNVPAQGRGGYIECREGHPEDCENVLRNTTADKSWIYDGAFVSQNVVVKNNSMIAPRKGETCIVNSPSGLVIDNSYLYNPRVSCDGTIVGLKTSFREDKAFTLINCNVEIEGAGLSKCNSLIAKNSDIKMSNIGSYNGEFVLGIQDSIVSLSNSAFRGGFQFIGANADIKDSKLSIGNVSGSKSKNGMKCSDTVNIENSVINTSYLVKASSCSINLHGKEFDTSTFADTDGILDFSNESITEKNIDKYSHTQKKQKSPEVNETDTTDKSAEAKPDEVKEEGIGSQFGDVYFNTDDRADTLSHNIGVAHKRELTGTELPNKKFHQKFDFDMDTTTAPVDTYYRDVADSKPSNKGRDISTYTQIRANKSFDAGHGKLHVSEGEWGGYLSYERNLDQSGSCWVGSGAMVTGDRKHYVREDAVVMDGAKVMYSTIKGSALVTGEGTRVSGIETVVEDNAVVEKGAVIKNGCHLFDNCVISGKNVEVSKSEISGNVNVAGSSSGDKIIIDNSVLTGSFTVLPGMNIINQKIMDNKDFDNFVSQYNKQKAERPGFWE